MMANDIISQYRSSEAKLDAFRDRQIRYVLATMRKVQVPEEMIPSYEDLDKTFQQKTPFDFYNRAFMNSCMNTGTRAVDIPRPYHMPQIIGRRIADWWYEFLLNTQLSKRNPQPVEIDFCAAILENPAGTLKLNRKESDIPAWCEEHSGLVLGRRQSPETGRCQYKVRSNDGSDMRNQGWYCDIKDPATQFCKHWKQLDHDNQDFWIDTDVVTGTMMGYSFF